MAKAKQYVRGFDHGTYRQAVALRVEAEKLGAPLLFEEAAALFISLDMIMAADGCFARAEYYRREHEQRNRAVR